MADDGPETRREWKEGPVAAGGAASPLLALSDDELLFYIEALASTQNNDQELMVIVRSDRHFFIRQEAAKKIKDPHLLKEQAGDRHIGQILVRGMTRSDDEAYLTRLMAETRHLEVRKAADAQLKLITRAKERG